MRILLLLLLASAGTRPCIAQSLATDLQAATAGADEALLASDAVDLDPSDKKLVDTAMKRTEEGASREELDRMPLPTQTPFTASIYALESPSAWNNRSASLHSDDTAVIGIQELASEGGELYYLEHVCATGNEQVIAAQVVGLLARVLTKYSERMLLENFIRSRKSHIPYSSNRCDRNKLPMARKRFVKFYLDVTRLAILPTDER